ncbi:MAG: PQQ-binding-like beta-propeller repeat protein [Bacteroidales bacterium]
MSSRQTVLVIIAITVFAVVFIWWRATGAGYHIVKRVPGMDERPVQARATDSVAVGENFEFFSEPDAIVQGSWICFRGKDRDNISKENIQVAEKWDTSGPPVVWSAEMGEGYAGAAVMNGRVYVLDYNERLKSDMLRCFSLSSGTELWRRWYRVEFKRNHGYSRTVPYVTDKYVVTMGPRSHVMCLDAITGNLVWTKDLEKEFGVPDSPKGKITPEFYNGQCPLIDNGKAIFAPGGKALMVAYELSTGNTLWQVPNTDSVRMSHTSIMPMTIFGKRMYVYHALGGVYGVSAEESDQGKLLWKTNDWNPSIVVASPIYMGNGEILAFGTYGAGTAKIKVSRNGDTFTATVVQKHKPNEGIAAEQHTPIKTGEYIWTVMPDNSGELKRQLVCYHVSDIQKPVWTSGRDLRFGKGMGPFIMNGNNIFLLDDDGGLYLFRIEQGKATLLAQHKVLNAIEAWAPMSLAGNYLILRDAHNMLCLNIGKTN